MDIKRLKYFVAVAEELNILKAATRMNISQPPLTRHIKLLEEELKTQLFVRTTRGVELTEAGSTLLEEAKNLIALAELAAERTYQAGQGLLGRIDVGLFGSAVFGVIPKILLAFRKAYPAVTMVLHNQNKAEQIDALRQRRLTVGFNRFIEPMPDIRAEKITTEDLFVAVNRSDPLSKKKQIPWSELAHHPLVLFPSGARPNFIDYVLDLCRQDGFLPKVVQEVGDAVNGVALVASGFGLCIVPDSATNMHIPGVAYRPLVRNPPPQVDLSCIYRTNDESPILREFLTIARSFPKE
ncbi:MAG: LysR family transcriptional regulator [Rhodocyclaceae bacterium]|nr:MAG: LysR family transcriptional regulator [Rhodocyclaceae bacterium]